MVGSSPLYLSQLSFTIKVIWLTTSTTSYLRATYQHIWSCTSGVSQISGFLVGPDAKTAYDFVFGVFPYQSLISKLLSQFFLLNDHSILPKGWFIITAAAAAAPPRQSTWEFCSVRINFVGRDFAHFCTQFFFLSFFSNINTSSLLIFNLLIGGKRQLIFSIVGPDLLRLSGATHTVAP